MGGGGGGNWGIFPGPPPWGGGSQGGGGGGATRVICPGTHLARGPRWAPTTLAKEIEIL